MSTEERLDRTVFKRQTVEQAADTIVFWKNQTPAYRLRSAYLLSLRAYGYDPTHEPRLDRTAFSVRKHEQ